MPVVTVDLLAGYDAKTKARLGTSLTDAVLGSVAAAPDAVTVFLNEFPADSYMRGGTHRQPGPPRPDPEALVRDFLTTMEARDLETAQTMLAPGFTMTFPGGVTMAALTELIEWSRTRYRFVRKTYARFDSLQRGETSIVYCHGTLAGEWLDGTAFEGIRFIDRFEIENGRFTKQEVWNDMAERKAQG